MEQSPLRALTVRQPHAWAIVEGHKDVENRSWRYPYAVPSTIAIHAAVKLDRNGLRVPTVDVPDDLVRGAVIGLVDVVDVHHADECDGCSAWAAPDHHHWVLDRPRRLAQPVPTRGYLWLFVPPPEVAALLTEE